jgi:hypothetical protein
MSQPFKWNPRAVALGYVTDMTTTKLFELAVLLVLLDPGSSSIRPLDRLDPTLLDSFGLVWGLFFTVLGGFVAGRRAPQARFFHAGLAGGLSLLTCLATYGCCPDDTSLALYHLGLLLTVPAALVGAKVAAFWGGSEKD